MLIRIDYDRLKILAGFVTFSEEIVSYVPVQTWHNTKIFWMVAWGIAIWLLGGPWHPNLVGLILHFFFYIFSSVE